jgi:hypothetical protein
MQKRKKKKFTLLNAKMENTIAMFLNIILNLPFEKSFYE